MNEVRGSYHTLLVDTRVGRLYFHAGTLENSVTTIQACQMSMDLMGIKREELIDDIDVVGVATFVHASEEQLFEIQALFIN